MPPYRSPRRAHVRVVEPERVGGRLRVQELRVLRVRDLVGADAVGVADGAEAAAASLVGSQALPGLPIGVQSIVTADADDAISSDSSRLEHRRGIAPPREGRILHRTRAGLEEVRLGAPKAGEAEQAREAGDQRSSPSGSGTYNVLDSSDRRRPPAARHCSTLLPEVQGTTFAVHGVETSA